MFFKLVFRNAKKSIKDYLIYIITLTLCVTLFYAFTSVSSKYYHPKINSEYSINVLTDGMKIVICCITLLLLFLIHYVNNYLLLRKKKEIALEVVMGMERRTISKIFLGETLLMGSFSLVIGIIMGSFVSQLLTVLLLKTCGGTFDFHISLYPDTVKLTILFFLISFLIVGGFNRREIHKLKIVDLLKADKMNEEIGQKEKWIYIITLLYLIMIGFMIWKGSYNLFHYYDTRYYFLIKIILIGNVVCPLIAFVCCLIWGVNRKKKEFDFLLKVNVLLEIPSFIFMLGIPYIYANYYVSFGTMTREIYTGFSVFHIIYTIFILIYLISMKLQNVRIHSVKYAFKEENLFFLGQITTKLSTTTKSMGIICSTIVLSIFLFFMIPALDSWLYGYLEVRSLYDIQIYSRYNKTHRIEEINTVNYHRVEEFLQEEGIEIEWENNFKLFLSNKEEFVQRRIDKFPVLAISLTEYNQLRQRNGLQSIKLHENEFTTQWQAGAQEEEIYNFIENHQILKVESRELSISDQPIYDSSLGESLYNNYTNVIYIIPDEMCKQLLSVNYNYYIDIKEPLTFQEALSLEKFFYDSFPSTNDGIQYEIRISTLEKNSTYASSFTLRASLIYTAVVLLIICYTMLALQQLYDASNYKYRFQVLSKIGVDQKHIKSLIFKQICFWFGVPLSISFIFAVALIVFFYSMISTQISAYVVISDLIRQIIQMIIILVSLFGSYFLTTWYLFQRAIRNERR